MPNAEERREILSVHLRKRERNPEDFDLDRLSEESDGYVGAELEQGILDAMYIAFNEDREISTGDVSQALRALVPLSISQRERILILREWLEQGRAQSASLPDDASEAEELAIPPRSE